MRKSLDGKLIIVIYQRTADGRMRGGSEAAFDGDMICKGRKHLNWQENEFYWDKNRYHENTSGVIYKVGQLKTIVSHA